MELISIAGSVIGFLAILIVGLIGYTVKENNKLRENENAELKRLIEKLDTQLRILENEKFNLIMIELAEIRKDISSIQDKIK